MSTAPSKTAMFLCRFLNYMKRGLLLAHLSALMDLIKQWRNGASHEGIVLENSVTDLHWGNEKLFIAFIDRSEF